MNEVREKGADIVILITHLGESDDEDNGYATNKLVSRVRGIDAVIDGHSHATYSNRLVDPDGREIVTAQTGEKLAEIGRMDIAADGTITSQLIDRVPEPEGLPYLTVARRNGEVCVDPDMNRLIQKKILEYTPVIDRKIGEVAFDLLYCSEVGIDFGRSEETGLANLLSDAYRSVGGADLSLVIAGTVRNEIQQGNITYRDILNILPYSNDLLRRKLKGQDILDALEWGARILPEGSSSLMQGSGLAYKVDLSRPGAAVADPSNSFDHIEGEYRVYDVRINGEPLDPDRIYTCVLDNFVAEGGDGFTMLVNDDSIYTGTTNTDVLADFIEHNLNGVIPDNYRNPAGRLLIVK